MNETISPKEAVPQPVINQAQPVQTTQIETVSPPPSANPPQNITPSQQKPLLSPYWILIGLIFYLLGYVVYLISNKRVNHNSVIGHVGVVATLLMSGLVGGFSVNFGNRLIPVIIVLIIQAIYTSIIFIDSNMAHNDFKENNV